MDEDEKREQSAAARVGVDYAIKLSYVAVDKSDLPNKRDIIYSLVCFGCMFDEIYATEPDSIVKKYDCLNYPEPKKTDLYELAYTVASLECDSEDQRRELKKSWYLTFAYVLLSEAPHSPEIFAAMQKLLCREDVFKDVLESRFSVYVPPTKEELAAQGTPDVLAEWYSPYLDYCAERDENGVTRETRECKRLLALGDFNNALMRSERLLAAFPDDFQIAITDIAARVSLSGAANKQSRETLLKDTLSLIDDYIDIAEGQYFRYYRGLTLLGLMDTVGARAEFESCLAAEPNFELAALMLKGMDKYEK